jgi:xylulokinase
VAGIDSSTQSCKVLVIDAGSGAVVRSGAAAHPDGTEVDPARWWDALGQASEAAGLDGVEALSVGAQQHGMVALDAAGEVVRPALLWNDTRSAPQARQMVERLGAQAWADAVGSVPLPAFTVTKVAWLAEHEPELASAVATVLLPHDWLTWRLLGRPAEPTTDRSDASGTGYCPRPPAIERTCSSRPSATRPRSPASWGRPSRPVARRPASSPVRGPATTRRPPSVSGSAPARSRSRSAPAARSSRRATG